MHWSNWLQQLTPYPVATLSSVGTMGHRVLGYSEPITLHPDSEMGASLLTHGEWGAQFRQSSYTWGVGGSISPVFLRMGSGAQFHVLNLIERTVGSSALLHTLHHMGTGCLNFSGSVQSRTTWGLGISISAWVGLIERARLQPLHYHLGPQRAVLDISISVGRSSLGPHGDWVSQFQPGLV